MTQWKKVKIGEIFSIEKGSLQSSKNTSGNYNFITAASEWKTHNSYDHDCEAIVYAVAASGSLGRAHYVNGKFIASDLCFILTEKDKKKYPINFQFYQIIFEMMRDEIVSKTKTGTSKESISRGNFSNYEIPYFSIDFQLANYQQLVETKNKILNLLAESEKQKSYIKQLRQNILQDAIEGKLTADWRKDHPVIKGDPNYDAEALFEKIQEEKTDKKQKSYPAITDEDKPFDIPEGWKWVSLSSICSKIGSGSTPKGSDYCSSGIPFFRSQNVYNEGLVYKDLVFISDFTHNKMKGTKVLPNDLLLNITGGSLGRCAVVSKEFDKGNVSQHVCIIRPIITNSFYLHIFILSELFQNNIKTSGAGRQGLPKYNLEKMLLPLPPLKEQEKIVNKVEHLLAKVVKLEDQIVEREKMTRLLLYSIIKKFFDF